MTTLSIEIRRFGYCEERENRSIDITVSSREWTAENLAELEKLTEVIFVLQPIVIALDVAERNYLELIDAGSNFVSRLDKAETQISAAATTAIDGLVHSTQGVTNFLASASAFLTQTEARLGQIAGRDSSEFKFWNEQRKNEHASKFAYRFLYELRNYSQHMSLPISNFGISGNRAEADSTMSFTVGLTVSRDQLIQSGFNWKKLCAEIAVQTPDFQLLPLLAEYMQSLRQLCLAAISIYQASLAECANYFSVLQRIFAVPAGAIPALFVYDSGDTTEPPSRQEQIPVHQLAYLFRRWDALINSCASSVR
jgi:hypothetical protein